MLRRKFGKQSKKLTNTAFPCLSMAILIKTIKTACGMVALSQLLFTVAGKSRLRLARDEAQRSAARQVGEVRAELTDNDGCYLASCRDRNNDGAFYEEMRSYLKSDKELYAAIEDGRLDIIDCNWFEWIVFDNEKGEYIGPDAFDNIFEDQQTFLGMVNVETLQKIVDYTKEWEGIV